MDPVHYCVFLNTQMSAPYHVSFIFTPCTFMLLVFHVTFFILLLFYIYMFSGHELLADALLVYANYCHIYTFKNYAVLQSKVVIRY